MQTESFMKLKIFQINFFFKKIADFIKKFNIVQYNTNKSQYKIFIQLKYLQSC